MATGCFIPTSSRRAFVGVVRPDGLLAAAVAEIRFVAAPNLLVRDAVVKREPAGVPADVERLFGRRPRQHEAIHGRAGRTQKGTGQRLRRAAPAVLVRRPVAAKAGAYAAREAVGPVPFRRFIRELKSKKWANKSTHVKRRASK